MGAAVRRVWAPMGPGCTNPARWERALKRSAALLLVLGFGVDVAHTAFAQGRAALVNVDAVIVLEKPKLGPFRDAIRESLADKLGVSTDRVSVKAKTAEGLGPVGQGEAAEAHVVVLVSRSQPK